MLRQARLALVGHDGVHDQMSSVAREDGPHPTHSLLDGLLAPIEP
jgi:hypothetical protein